MCICLLFYIQGFSGCLSNAKIQIARMRKGHNQCAHIFECLFRVSTLQVSAMPNPYSLDLRWRVVWLSLTQRYSAIPISRLLHLSERTVRRYITIFQQTGDVMPK